MKSFTIDQIVACIGADYKTEGNQTGHSIDNVSIPTEATTHSLIWIKPANNHSGSLETSAAKVIICDYTLTCSPEILQEKLLIRVDNPKLAFIRVATALFGEKREYGIHPSATVDINAKIGEKVFIGPNTIIGESVIGDNVVIAGNVFIGNKVRIGNNVFINAGVVIGSEGFGYSRNNEGVLEKFPHFGGVVIEDDVEIGSNTCIDRGTLGNTLLKQGAKIDNLVHIAHNVVVGRNSLVIANAMVGGSTTIGDETWIAPSVNLMNGIKIGNKVTIGMSALVTKNVPDGETWAGVPASSLEKYLELQKKIKNL
jgi:UDP-3-O-[3-hydroxymyristoyl] glucosamine N-acyltransferase